MGSPSSEKDRAFDECPQHTVKLLVFSIGRHEVTEAERQEVMG
jgi:formylglycine-generating enzyme required for sulfatase activity